MEEKTTSTFSSIVCFHQTGTHHIQEGSDCEDVSVVIEQADFRFWGLADGQSEKEYCKTGGRAVLYAVAAHLQKKGLHTLAQHGYLDEVQYELIRVIRDSLTALSKEYRADPSEFASTLLAFAQDPVTQEYIAVHLGDGNILALDQDNHISVLSGAENGITHEYTWLTASANSMQHLRIQQGTTTDIKRLVMVTDGATVLCCGCNIVAHENILTAADACSRIPGMIRQSAPEDDASCIIVDF